MSSDKHIKGVKKNSVLKYTGIPYARSQRYQKSEIVPFNDQLDATSPSPACPQNAVPYLKEILGSDPISIMDQKEACQHLSITRPTASTESDLPVVVWIHGGSYTSGAGDAHVYDPSEWVAQENIIVVSLTYRLGLFGFLGNDSEKPANLGISDITIALQWIQKYISKFGGNPNQVTLYGQSAGGDAIANLMLLENSESWFQKAIITSAPFGLTRGRSKMYDAMLTEMQKHDLNGSVSSILEAEEAIEKSAQSFGLKGAMPFGVQYGFAPFPNETEIDRIWQERASKFEILFGTTASETTLYIPRFQSMQKWFRLPIIGNPIKNFVVRYTTQKIYKKPGLKWAKKMAQSGSNVTFSEIQWGVKSNSFGATHAIDTVLLFGQWESWKDAAILDGVDEQDFKTARSKIMKFWGSFAKGKNNLKSVPGVIAVQ